MSAYQVGVDLGTTYSAVALCRGDGPVELVPLGQRANSVPSTVYAGPDGAFLIGEEAERRALSDPGRVVREFKRRIGDPTPVLVGREPVPAEELAARFISRLLRDVAGREKAVAARVAITHPADWGPHKLDSMRGVLAEHGLGSAVLLTEPQAAAVGYANAERVEPGATVAVYDLGGGTFDAAVVRKTAAGGFELLGSPEGLSQLGGVDFDEAVFAHVREALGAEWAALDPTDPEVLAAVSGLRRECTAAKEALSHDTEVLIPVLLPGLCTQVRLGRAEFEEMIRPAVGETLAAMRRALASAGVSAADLGALLLVGGSSRIPLITQAVSAEFGRSAAVDVDPKGVIAAGAALVARAAERGSAAAAAAARRQDVPPQARAAPEPIWSGPAAPRPEVPPSGRAPADRATAARTLADRTLADRTLADRTLGDRTPADRDTAGRGRPAIDSHAAVPAAAVPRLSGPAPRPPKQARPFAAAVDAPERPRRLGVGIAAGVLALLLLGGAVAFGANQIGANREAGAVEPVSSSTTVSPVATPGVSTPPPLVTTAPPVAEPPAPDRRPARTRARPPAPRTTAPPPAVTTTPPPAVTTTSGAAPADEPPAVDGQDTGAEADQNGNADQGDQGDQGDGELRDGGQPDSEAADSEPAAAAVPTSATPTVIPVTDRG